MTDISPNLHFERVVLRCELDDPMLSRVVRGVCRLYIVYPSSLFDTGIRENRTVTARHVAWRLAYLLTDLSIETIAELTASNPATVVRWATSWKPHAHRDPHLLGDGDPFWQRHVELVLGPLCDALGLPFEEWPAELRGRREALEAAA